MDSRKSIAEPRFNIAYFNFSECKMYTLCFCSSQGPYVMEEFRRELERKLAAGEAPYLPFFRQALKHLARFNNI